jgi:hypothetical protein
MGWRAALRSANAAQRRAERERQRQLRDLRKTTQKVDGYVAKLSTEVEEQLRKVAALEERIHREPIRALDLDFAANEGWTSKDVKGGKAAIIEYQLRLNFPVAQAVFNPATVDVDECQIRPLACSLSQYATFVAFAVTTVRPSAHLDVVNRSTPEKSRLVVGDSSERIFFPLDETLDGTAIANRVRIGTVAFDPFDGPVQRFSLLFLPRKRKGVEDDEPVTIEVSGSGVLEQSTAVAKVETLVERFRSSVEDKQEELNHNARRLKGRARSVGRMLRAPNGSGCLLLLSAVLGGAAVAASLTRSVAPCVERSPTVCASH